MDQKQTSKSIRVFALMVSAEVKKRAGRVEIPPAAIVAVLTRGFKATPKGDTLEFTLKDDDGKRRDSTTYSDRFLYKLDVVMKHLIATSPEKKLVFTNQDLVLGNVSFSINAHKKGLIAQTNMSAQPLAVGERAIILGQESVVLFDDSTPTPSSKRN